MRGLGQDAEIEQLQKGVQVNLKSVHKIYIKKMKIVVEKIKKKTIMRYPKECEKMFLNIPNENLAWDIKTY